MLRRFALVACCISVGCGTVENEPSDASVIDGGAGDGPGDVPDGGPGPGDPDAGPTGPLAIGDGSHDFQRVTVGATGQPFTTRISNVSGAPQGPLQVTITGAAAAEFAVSEDGCDERVLGAGTDCQVTVNFHPQQPGARAARLAVTAGEAAVGMDLAGIGLTLGALAITPGDGHGFGQVTIGQTSDSHTFTVTNTGESSIGRPTLSVLDTVNFVIDDDTCAGELAPLGTCTVTASFKPTTGGAHTTSLLAASGDNMAAAALAGTGAGRIVVSKAGDGAAISTVVGGGIDCGSSCQATIAEGSVALVASVPANTELTAWSIASCGTSARCEVPVDRASRTVEVTFRRRYQLSINRTGTGSGRVVATGGGIDCGTDCDELLFAQTAVVLRATPETGNTFVGWSGCNSVSGDTCNVTVAGDGAQVVTARFERTQTLSVSVSGNGTITSSPSGISCPTDCSEPYSQGTTVVLTANPGSAHMLSSWGGACQGTGRTSPCTLTMDAAKSAQATFVSRYVLTVRPGVQGATITVSPTPSGGSATCTNINGCTHTYNSAVTVGLSALHPSPITWVFDGWSGDCSGTGNGCTVHVTEPSSAVTNYHMR